MDLTTYVQSLFRSSSFLGHFSLYTPMGSGVTMRDPAHVTQKINLCMYTIFKSVAPKVCMAKVPFLAFFEHRNGCGHIHILKTFPRLYWYQIYIWVHGLTFRFKCLCLYTIFGIFSLTQEKEELQPGRTQPMSLPEWSCICIPTFRSVAPRVFLAKIPFLAFSCYCGNHFPGIFSPSFKLGQNLSSCQVS